MKTTFGLLFLMAASLLVVLQAILFLFSISIESSRILLVTIITLGSLISSHMVFEEGSPSVLRFVTAVTLLLCLGLILYIAAIILLNNTHVAGWELSVSVLYALSFGAYGYYALDRTKLNPKENIDGKNT